VETIPPSHFCRVAGDGENLRVLSGLGANGGSGPMETRKEGKKEICPRHCERKRNLVAGRVCASIAASGHDGHGGGWVG